MVLCALYVALPEWHPAPGVTSRFGASVFLSFLDSGQCTGRQREEGATAVSGGTLRSPNTEIFLVKLDMDTWLMEKPGLLLTALRALSTLVQKAGYTPRFPEPGLTSVLPHMDCHRPAELVWADHPGHLAPRAPSGEDAEAPSLPADLQCSPEGVNDRLPIPT